MIITKQKSIDDILVFVGSSPVFLMGCSECATVCKTGGEEEVLEMKNVFEEKGVVVTGWVVLDPACNFLNDKRILRKYNVELEKAEKIVVLSCGNGVQTVSEIIDDKPVFSGTDTLFLGEVKRFGKFERRCNLCGECIEDEFGGFCPISRCPKKMLNGPCGGSVDGKCEVDSDLDCIWDLIYQKFRKENRLDEIKKFFPAKDWSKSLDMNRRNR
jgi:ferredoxin